MAKAARLIRPAAIILCAALGACSHGKCASDQPEGALTLLNNLLNDNNSKADSLRKFYQVTDNAGHTHIVIPQSFTTKRTVDKMQSCITYTYWNGSDWSFWSWVPLFGTHNADKFTYCKKIPTVTGELNLGNNNLANRDNLGPRSTSRAAQFG